MEQKSKIAKAIGSVITLVLALIGCGKVVQWIPGALGGGVFLICICTVYTTLFLSDSDTHDNGHSNIEMQHEPYIQYKKRSFGGKLFRRALSAAFGIAFIIVAFSLFKYRAEVSTLTNRLPEQYQSGYNQGYTDGEAHGSEIGYDNGYSEGIEKGKAQGIAAGHRDGYNEGYEDAYDAGESSGYFDGFWDGYDLISDEYTFYHAYACIVTTNGYRYHRFGCYHIDGRPFFIYNTDTAESWGYSPCLDCWESGEKIKSPISILGLPSKWK